MNNDDMDARENPEIDQVEEVDNEENANENEIHVEWAGYI
jgi:hypothetical protein